MFYSIDDICMVEMKMLIKKMVCKLLLFAHHFLG